MLLQTQKRRYEYDFAKCLEIRLSGALEAPRPSPAPWLAGLSAGEPRGGRPNTCDLSDSQAKLSPLSCRPPRLYTRASQGQPHPGRAAACAKTAKPQPKKRTDCLGRHRNDPARTGSVKTSRNALLSVISPPPHIVKCKVAAKYVIYLTIVQIFADSRPGLRLRRGACGRRCLPGCAADRKSLGERRGLFQRGERKDRGGRKRDIDVFFSAFSAISALISSSWFRAKYVFRDIVLSPVRGPEP